MSVYPDVNVTSGGLYSVCNLWVIQSHLSQNLLLAATVFWHPIVSGGVHIHGPISGDLGVNHHLVWVSDATRARQLGEETVNIKAASSIVRPTGATRPRWPHFDLPPLAEWLLNPPHSPPLPLQPWPEMHMTN